MKQQLEPTPTTFVLYLSPSDEFKSFGVRTNATFFFKTDFLQEGMIRIANFFASFTCLCNSNQLKNSEIEKL